MLWSRILLAKAAIILIQLVAWSVAAMGQPMVTGDALYLEVFINGQPTGLIANFVLRPSQRLAITVAELRELRIKPERLPVGTDGLVELDRCLGLSYQYDVRMQVVRIEIGDQVRQPFLVDAKARPDVRPSDPPTPGVVVNYTLFSSAGLDTFAFAALPQMRPKFSAGLDARAFGPYGVLSQTTLLNSAITASAQAVRLESTWSYSNPDTMTTYRVGDIISGGLNWTRSLRLGGAQVQRNFALRPDLVLLPMPQYSGSAALPSTVDVFVNGMRSYSTSVPAGPFQLQNLPVMSGASNQSIVVQDALGRQTVVNQPFYASSKLLASGLFDFSLESGFVRREFGVSSGSYDRLPAASGSFRYGLNDRVTVEGHAEGADNLINGGGGVNVLLSNWGVASLASAGSCASGNPCGAMVAASLEIGRGGYTFFARTQRTTATYLDLASLPSFATTAGTFLLGSRPSRAIDQIALNAPLAFDASSVTLSMTRMQDALSNRYDILAASYSRPLPYNASLFVTAFKDFENRSSFGIFGGLTMSFGGGISAASSLSRTGSGFSGGLEVVKSQSLEVDSWGWRLRDVEGQVPARAATVSYRSSVGRAELGVQQIGGKTQGTAQVDGAVAIVGGSSFFTNRIDDAFAVVDAGAPNIDVFFENRPIATTGASGMVLVPYLRANQMNSISIDPKNLAADADVPSTKASVVPPDRGASLVKFGVSQDARNALVVVKTPDGRVVAPGSRARFEGAKEETVVGYGGEIYLRGLKDRNILLVAQVNGSTCRAEFDYKPTPGRRVLINDVVCR